jgi:hypothetical protein
VTPGRSRSRLLEGEDCDSHQRRAGFMVRAGVVRGRGRWQPVHALWNSKVAACGCIRALAAAFKQVNFTAILPVPVQQLSLDRAERKMVDPEDLLSVRMLRTSTKRSSRGPREGAFIPFSFRGDEADFNSVHQATGHGSR